MNEKHDNDEIIAIEALIKEHPLTKLSNFDYGSVLLTKLKGKFTTFQQKIFVTNCFMYLNYDPTKFLILLDDIWSWIGFGRLGNAKRLLVNNFTENVDYKIENLASPNGEASLHGGHNQENILLTVRCFKKLCLKAKTKRSNEIHDYYIELEEIVHETVLEQSDKLMNQLQIKDREIEIEKEKYSNVTGKRVFEKVKGQFVYIYKSNPATGCIKYKIGETESLTNRQSEYLCGNPDGKIVFEKSCINSKLSSIYLKMRG